MITVNNIYKQYGGKHALNGLSFTAENGSVLGFIGPNGPENRRRCGSSVA